ncbi:MAG: peptidoglycan DD-metalloendopeptidase family protein [Bacteroidia bacterium]|nr:peptidoglycan DD-metalloendopeptidase family protein [Bacteroidia bacterium]
MKNRLSTSVIIGSAVVFFIFGYFFIQNSQSDISFSLSSAAHKVTENQLTSPKLLYGIPIDSMIVINEVVKANENLSEILARYNVPAATIFKIATLPREIFDVRRLLVNKSYTIIHQKDSMQTAKSFIYYPNAIDYVVINLDDSLEVETGQHRVDTVEHVLSGTITSSLYQSIIEEGGTPALVSELADVYAWAIDFFGLQEGDCFKMVYTTLEVQGQPAGFGRILTASFNHASREYRAYSFDQGEGSEYFDEEGNSLRKTFLKAPLKYSRISSHFSYNRFHPVLKIRRPHLGVDYAAPVGTPVVTVGDGVVLSVGYNGGAGKMVKIRHNSNFTTAYLHLSSYGEGIREGAAVRQGEVIGYVGSTGVSTGPHLDFRFYKNGVPVDPLQVEPPSANPICEQYREDFHEAITQQQKKLDKVGENSRLLAME